MGWSRASTNTSFSTGSSPPPVGFTTSPVTGSWATTWNSRAAIGWRATTPAYLSTTVRGTDHVMRVLVTGGSGFIGSPVVDRPRPRGPEPVIYDLRPSPWHERGS